jgi:hypothetical protein
LIFCDTFSLKESVINERPFEGKGEIKMRNLIISAIILVLLSLAINAQGKKYSNKEHGYNFVAPAGWTLTQEEGEKCLSFSFTNADKTIGIIVSAAHSVSLSDFLKNEYKVLNFGFSPQESIRENNGVQAIRLIKADGGYKTTMDAVLLPLSENDGVAVMTLIGSDAYIQEAHNAVVQILRSVKLSFGRKLKKAFTDMENGLASQSNQNGSSASSGGSSPNSAWGRMLAGKKLEYFKGGYSRIYRFCGGSFSQNGESLYSSNDGSYGNINNRLGGSWDVQGNTLILRYNSGTVTNFELSQGEDTGGVRLDGTFYRMTQADCS